MFKELFIHPEPATQRKVEFQITRPAPVSVVPKKSANEIATLLVNADLLIRHGEIPEARSLVSKALLLDSRNVEALKRLVQLTRDPDVRIRALEVAVSVSEDFEALFQLAQLEYELGRDLPAKEHYTRALAIMHFEPKAHFEIYKNLANIFVRSGDFEAAQEFYNKAHTLQPKSDTLNVNLATVAIQQSDWEDALQKLKLAASINAQNDKARVGLALAYNYLGDFALAKGNLEEAIALNPRNRTAVHLNSQWAVRDMDYTQAIAALEHYLSEVVDDEEMSLVLIHLFCLSNQKNLARLELERALLWNPQSPHLAQIEKELTDES